MTENGGENWPSAWRPREHWANPTYDEGGVLPPGSTLVQNTTGKPEQVVCPANPDSPDASATAGE